jgi:TonB family protein
MTRMSRIPCFLAVAVLLGTLWAQNAAPPASGTDVTNPPNSNPERSASGTTPSQTTADSATLVATRAVKAIYPLQAEKNKLEGQVVVKAAISENGDVESVEVVSGDPTLAQAAIDAAKEWKFRPFIRNGKPTKASTKLTFNFVFRDQVPDDKSAMTAATLAKTAPTPGLTTVRVSEKVAQQMALKKVEPVYPQVAKISRITGTVVMLAVIGKEGKITALQLISGHPLLAPAALKAVKEWNYRPYIFDGEPVEVQTTIEVHFTLY